MSDILDISRCLSLEVPRDISENVSVTEICVLLEFYTAYSGNSVPTFRDNLSIHFSRVKKSNNNDAYLSVRLPVDREEAEPTVLARVYHQNTLARLPS
jgi:predicted nucleic acid-binding protein